MGRGPYSMGTLGHSGSSLPGQDSSGVCHRTGPLCRPGTGPGADGEPGLPPFMQSHHSKQHGHGWAGWDGSACAGQHESHSKAQQMDVACGWLVAMGWDGPLSWGRGTHFIPITVT